ncbi:Asp23/Gls24 family protein [Subtercola sp. Z020]|uniref:Asp23/Gls24 family envelope stress response protein n=1 Tax=Subtercola sp. Z020 TaxID=2080582 RepID=UPI000CE7726E|nr:Asp23/Gls24 family envelope stress response protein [Subtercola sp. Z020]PPF76789.1 Asp23/Gls24 family protein [Subtercola sp. Z020]
MTDALTAEQQLSTTVANIAAGVVGVHHLGGLAARTLDRATRSVLGTSTEPGVTVSRVDGRTVVDIDLVVEYPHTIARVVDETRDEVVRAAESLVSGPVQVNVAVTDIHGPFDPIAPDPAEVAADAAADAASDAATAVATGVDAVADAANETVEPTVADDTAAADTAADTDATEAPDADAADADPAETDRDAASDATPAPAVIVIEAPATVVIDTPDRS